MRVEQRIQSPMSRVRLDSWRSMICSIIPDTADTAIVGEEIYWSALHGNPTPLVYHNLIL